jgi:hypothetical protein
MKKITLLLIAMCATTVAFAQNTSLNFDGEDDYVSLGANYAFDNTDSFSVEAWVKLERTMRFEQIVSKLDANFTGWGLQVHEDGSLSGYLFSDWGVNSIFAVGSTFITDANWHHVAMTFDGDKTVKLYVDGEEEILSEETLLGANLESLLNNADTHIGNYEGTGSPDEYLTGSIDEVRIWSKALSIPEIEDSFETEITGNEPDLAGYYKMDEQDLACDVVSCAPSLLHGSRGGASGVNDTPQYDTEVPSITDVACGAQMNCVLEVADFTLDSRSLYPNPTLGMLEVQSEQTMDVIRVYTTSGALVQEVIQTNRIDLSAHTNGMYFVTLQYNDQQITKKIIKL